MAAAAGVVMPRGSIRRSRGRDGSESPGTGSLAGSGIKLEGNVFDDDSQDVLTGSQGDDWFLWNSVEDRATDLGDEVFATAT
jgi:hypothetical protein